MSGTGRTIIVVGATGNQGRAFIASVSESETLRDVRIVALTRRPTNVGAKALAGSERVEVVEADLDRVESVRKVFEEVGGRSGGIWGVFLVLAYPGLGADATGEKNQGILVVELAVEFRVQHLIYSSAERGGEGEGFDDKLDPSGKAKVEIERHIRLQKAMKWTILRPAFFMENFDGSIGRITATVLRSGLDADTKMQLIAVEDIGHIARAVFENTDSYPSREIVVVGDLLTVQEQAEAYRRGAGRPLPSYPNILGKAVLLANKHTRTLMARLKMTDVATKETKEPNLAQCRAMHPGMRTFEDWARRRGARGERASKWNNVSIWALARGKR